MPDRERVIQHFEDCIGLKPNSKSWVFVRVEMLRQALELLKEQEPRVLTLEEVMNSDAPVVVDYYDTPLCYASFARDVSSKKWARFYTFGEEGFIKLLIEDYNERNTWRCWSARPTDEQREAVKWDE